MTLPNLPLEIIEQIALYLPLSYLVRCKLVCKDWKEVLSSEQFYKRYTLHNYDWTEGKPTLFLNEWLSPEEWFCYWTDDEQGADRWVFAKPPKEWNCGIVHPADLKPEKDVTIKFSDFLVAMTKLEKLKKGADEFEIDFIGWGNEGSSSLQPFLMPWSKESLPRDDDMFDLFKFNPAMREGCQTYDINEHTKTDEDEDEEDEDEDDSMIRWQSLACYTVNDEAQKFFQFLKQLFCPAVKMCIGCEALNSVPVFLLVKLAPGWVGGYMSGVTCT